MRGLIALGLMVASLFSASAQAQRRRPHPTPPVAPAEPAPAPAPTPTPEPPSAGEEEARALFAAGRIAYTEARYQDALDSFTRAYERSHRAELLYNMGQCQDRLRHDRDAISTFERYLAELPEAPNRLEVETRLGVLREAVAQQDSVVVSEPLAPAPTTGEGPGLIGEWWFWTVIGVVVVGAAVGIGVAAGSREEPAPPLLGSVGTGGVVYAVSAP